MFELKLDFLAFASIRKTLNRALTKANGSRNIQIFPIVCYRSRGPTVISYWMKNESCVLYRSYLGKLRSFKRPGYLEVRREKSRFFLATNLQGHPTDLFLTISVLQRKFCWLELRFRLFCWEVKS